MTPIKGLDDYLTHDPRFDHPNDVDDDYEPEYEKDLGTLLTEEAEG